MNPSAGSDHRGEGLFVAFVLAFVLVHLLCYASTVPLFHEEPRRAIVAQEMLLTGEYVVPHIFQVPYAKKPPLHNWLIAAVSAPSGVVTSFAARSVSAVSFVAAGLVLYLFLRPREPSAALPAFCLFMTNVLLLFEYGGKVEPDMLMTALGMLAFVLYLANPARPVPVALSALAMGAGILTKGVLPLFFYPAALLLAWRSDSPRTRRFLLLGGHAALAAALPLLWFWAYHERIGSGDLMDALSAEMASRAARGLWAFLSHLVTFPCELLAVLLPWSAAAFLLRRAPRGQAGEIHAFSLCAAAVGLLVFWLLPGGKNRYVMPALPFLAIVVAQRLDAERLCPRRWGQVAWTLGALAAAGAAGWAFNKGWITQGVLLAGAVPVLAWQGARERTALRQITLLTLAVFFVYQHSVYFGKTERKFDAVSTARGLVAEMPEPLPVVVDDEHHNPIRVALALEQALRRPVYSARLPRPPRYYLVTVPDPASQREAWVVLRAGEASP